MEKIDAYKICFVEKKVLPCFLSVGGFTDEAMQLCISQNIGTAEMINYYNLPES